MRNVLILFFLPVTLVGCLVFGLHKVYSEQSTVDKNVMEQVQLSIDDFYEAVNVGQRQVAYQSLLKAQQSLTDVQLSMTQRVLLEHHIALAKRALIESQTDGTFLQAVRLKLAVGTMIEPENKQLWRKYEVIMNEDLRRLHNSWQTYNAASVPTQFTELANLQRHFMRIELAAQMSPSASFVASVSQQLTRMERMIRLAASSNSPIEQQAMLDEQYEQLEQSLAQLFDDAQMASASLPDISTDVTQPMKLATMFVSLFIVGILTYVGLRKYRSISQV